MQVEADGCRRWCEQCHQRVHDLSTMGEAEARAFLAASAGEDVCVAYEHDRAGNILFNAEPAAPEPAKLVPLARLRRRPLSTPAPVAVELARLASVASLTALLAACTPHDPVQSVRVVSDPVGAQTQPMVVIPPAARPTSPDTHERAEEPCEPTPPRPTLAKKGKRKRVGRRAPSRPSTLDL